MKSLDEATSLIDCVTSFSGQCHFVEAHKNHRLTGMLFRTQNINPESKATVKNIDFLQRQNDRCALQKNG